MKKLTLLLMLSMVLLAGLTMAIAQTKPTTFIDDDPNVPPELCAQTFVNNPLVFLNDDDDPNIPPELY